MALPLDFTNYSHALGRYEASWRFADAELRRAFGLWVISAAWNTYRLDAGPGEVGQAHEEHADVSGILRVDDPRRDAVLIWLLDHGTAEIAEAARTLVHMVAAKRRFSADEHDRLHEACDAMGSTQDGPIARMTVAATSGGQVTAPLMIVARTLDHLRGNEAFVEARGEGVFLPIAGRSFSHYVPAPPAATWALNLALLTPSSPLAWLLPLPGLAKRMSFRLDAEPEECAAELVETVAAALTTAGDVIEHLHAELGRGRATLAHLSRNSRAFEAWLLVAALGSLTRVQLTRALGLSRAGGDIQVRILADACLVTLGKSGRMIWVGDRPSGTDLKKDDHRTVALGAAVTDLNASMAAIDQLLARTSGR